MSKEKEMNAPKAKKPFYKKWWVWLLAIIVVIAVSNGDDEETPVAEEGTTEVASAEIEEEAVEEEVDEEVKEEPVEEPVGIGTPLDVKEVVFTINEISTATNVGGEYGQDAKGEYLILDVTVENAKKEAITVDASYFKLLIDDVEYEADTTAAIYANENAEFFYESVNPGLSLTGYVPFDAPEGLDLSTAQVQVQTGVFGTETGLINLQ